MSFNPNSHALQYHSSILASQPISLPDNMLSQHECIKLTVVSPSQSTPVDTAGKMTTRKMILDSFEPLMPISKYIPPRSTASPTVSTTRVRWDKLTEWTSLMSEAWAYVSNLSQDELYARVASATYRENSNEELEETVEPTDEATLRPWIKALFLFPHNVAVRPIAAVNAHAKIFEASAARFPHAGRCDYLFVYNGRRCGVVELKTYWKVTSEHIDEVINGKVFSLLF